MAKIKNPLLSLGAHGTVSKQITYQKRGRVNIARTRPVPTDRKTDLQIWHRYLYRQACQYWQTLSDSEKQQWETDARPYHMTGFAYFMRHQLKQLADLVLCLPMDETSGSLAADYSAHYNHGTIFGASHIAGKINYGLSFDGIDNLINCSPNPSLNLRTACFAEAWIYPTGWGKLDKGTIFWGGRYRLFLFNPGGEETIIAAFTQDITGKNAQAPNGSITLNQWQHVIAAMDGSHALVYVDNVETEGAACTLIDDGTGLPLIVGAQSVAGARTFEGIIDEFRLYGIDLPDADRKMHYERS